MYVCKICPHQTVGFKNFCAHVKSHRNLANYRFQCGVQQCPSNFRTFSAFRSHMHRNHVTLALPSVTRNLFQRTGIHECSVQECNHVADNISSLCVHLRFHIRNGKKVECPFEGCSKSFRVRSSFATHISRKHRQSSVLQHTSPDTAVNDSHVHEESVCPSDELNADSGSGTSSTVTDTFLNNLALFYLKMQAKLLLPATTIQCIIELGIGAILLLMKHFNENEDSIFILADACATSVSVQNDMDLPVTPRLIMLGNTLLTAAKWMISIEGKVTFVLEEHLNFAEALSVFFSSFYFFNIEYQEPACATLEFIQRFFVRINPEAGTKCTSKTGVSRRTGALVKRKIELINSRVSSFLRQLTEFEWKNSN